MKPGDWASATTQSKDGVRISCWIQPRASRTKIAGLHGQALKIALAAPPVDGKANAALVEFLADTLDIPKSSIEIVMGLSSRGKTVLVRGASSEGLVAKLCKSSGT